MFDPLFRQVAALWSVLWLALPAAVAGSPHYTVTTDTRLGQLAVRACFEAPLPDRLTTHDKCARGLLRDARQHTREGAIELKRQGSVLTLPRIHTPACVYYRVDLRAMPRSWRLREADRMPGVTGDA